MICALAAGCGEKEESLEPGRPRAARDHARLLPERRPRRDLRRRGGRALRGRRARRRDPPAAGPGGAAQAGGRRAASTWRSRTSPRCCGRGTRGSPSRPSARSCRRRSRRSSRCRRRASGRRRTSTARSWARPGSTTSRPTSTRSRRRARAEVEERNVGFNLTGALLAKKVDAMLGAFWNYEGTDLRLRGKNPQIIRLEQAGVPTYDELVFVANADQRGRPDQALHGGARARRRGPAARPGRGAEGPARREPRPRPEAPARGARRDAAALPAAARQALRLAGPEGVERVRPAGCATTSCSRT